MKISRWNQFSCVRQFPKLAKNWLARMARVVIPGTLHFTRAKPLCRSPHRDFYQGFLFGCLSSLFFALCCCFSLSCFWLFSLSFLPPLSPITSLLFLLSKTSSRRLVSCWYHSRPIIINCNLAYFLKTVNYRFQEGINFIYHLLIGKGVFYAVHRGMVVQWQILCESLGGEKFPKLLKKWLRIGCVLLVANISYC